MPSNASIRARDVRRAGWSVSIRVLRMRCCTLKLLCCIISPPPANTGAPSSEGAECLICPFIKLLPFHSHHGCNLTNGFYQTLASLCRGRGTTKWWWESIVLKLIRFETGALCASALKHTNFTHPPACFFQAFYLSYTYYS